MEQICWSSMGPKGSSDLVVSKKETRARGLNIKGFGPCRGEVKEKMVEIAPMLGSEEEMSDPRVPLAEIKSIGIRFK